MELQPGLQPYKGNIWQVLQSDKPVQLITYLQIIDKIFSQQQPNQYLKNLAPLQKYQLVYPGTKQIPSSKTTKIDVNILWKNNRIPNLLYQSLSESLCSLLQALQNNDEQLVNYEIKQIRQCLREFKTIQNIHKGYQTFVEIDLGGDNFDVNLRLELKKKLEQIDEQAQTNDKSAIVALQKKQTKEQRQNKFKEEQIKMREYFDKYFQPIQDKYYAMKDEHQDFLFCRNISKNAKQEYQALNIAIKINQ